MISRIKKHAKKLSIGASALTVAVCILVTVIHHQAAAAQTEPGVGMPDIENVETSAAALSESTPVSEAKPIRYSYYKIMKGDMIGGIAEHFALAQDTILSVNDIRNSRTLQVGQTLKIPNQDGIKYVIKAGDSFDKIAQQYEIPAESITVANNIKESGLRKGDSVFLPAARLSRSDLQEINGDMFIWPVRGYISSYYGYRTSPFTGAKQFHNGLDIAAPYGTPIKAGMGGTIRATGYDVLSGNYVVVSHHSGYRTLYCHMSVIRVKVGDYVATGQRIGDVGSTGLSTGSHCHFTVLKNGRTVNPLNLVN